MRRTTLLLVSTLILSQQACDSTPGQPDANDPMSPAFSFGANSLWGQGVSVDALGIRQVNTARLEGCPNESPNGRSLFFASDRDGQIDIWVARRNADGDWTAPEKLPPPVNSGANDFCPTALPDGGLLFVSTRDDGANCGTGTADIYEARPDPSGGWQQPVHLGCTLNSAGNEFSPSWAPAGGGMLFFSSDRSGRHRIHVSHRGPGGVWLPPEEVVELNLDPYNSVRPNVSPDGREIVFDSDRPGGLGGFDVWHAWRATPNALWSPPVNAGAAVNSPFSETRASLSRDGRRLYFGSNRPGVQGSSDIFVSHR